MRPRETASHLWATTDAKNGDLMIDRITQAIEDAVKEATHNEKDNQDQSDTTTSTFEVVGGEPEKVQPHMETVGEAVAEEREACAKVVERYRDGYYIHIC